jgi:hypothetical protein
MMAAKELATDMPFPRLAETCTGVWVVVTLDFEVLVAWICPSEIWETGANEVDALVTTVVAWICPSEIWETGAGWLVAVVAWICPSEI